MAESIELGSPPLGINILNCNVTRKTYVVNEVLNFYQRKLRVLGKANALNLAHHIFELEDIEYASKVLKDLWEWKKLSPSSANDYIIRPLGNRRKAGKNKLRIATDILNFFDVEDRNLDIIFLTLECEKIPSPVHESQAMNEVYILLHKSKEDYNSVMDFIYDRDERLANQGRLLESLRNEMKEGLSALSNTIKNSIPSKVSSQNDVTTVPLQIDTESHIVQSASLDNGHIVSEEEEGNVNEMLEPLVNGHADESLKEEDGLEEGELEESSDDEENNVNVNSYGER